MRVRIVFFKEDMTDEFFELLSTKEPQETLQNKETTVQNYRKMSNQYTNESPRIEFALFNCTREMGIGNFGKSEYLNLFYFYFVTSLRRKFMAHVRLQLNFPLPPIQASMLLAGRLLPPPNIRTL